MLQAVVGNNHLYIGMCRQQRPARFGAPGAHRHGRAGLAVKQQRLVARLRRRALLVQHISAAAFAPVAAADNARPYPARRQPVYQRRRNRRFPHTARVDIAHHHHRHGQFFAFQTACQKIPPPLGRNLPKQPRKRLEQQRQQRIRALPVAFNNLMELGHG